MTVTRTPRGRWLAELRRWRADADGYVVAKCTEPLATVEAASFIAQQWAREYHIPFEAPSGAESVS